jgi:hypothetical protein
MNFNFLDELFKGIGNVGADTDQFMKREMPFDSGWGAPAALAATIAAPQLIPYFSEAGASSIGASEGAGILSSGEGALGSGGMNGYLSSIGLGDAGSLSGLEAFQLPSSAYTPEYLDSLAKYQGVDAGDASLLDRLMGNTEQGLYKQEGFAQKASGQSISDVLKKQAQQKAISQLGQSGSKMQEQNNAQQAEQNRMAQLQAIMRGGQAVDTTTALLSLLQEKQQSKQPRISLI